MKKFTSQCTEYLIAEIFISRKFNIVHFCREIFGGLYFLTTMHWHLVFINCNNSSRVYSLYNYKI